MIHNAIDVSPNEEMFERGLSVAPEQNQIDLLLPGDVQNMVFRVAFYDELRYQLCFAISQSVHNPHN
jgi:hypothetical protein